MFHFNVDYQLMYLEGVWIFNPHSCNFFLCEIQWAPLFLYLHGLQELLAAELIECFMSFVPLVVLEGITAYREVWKATQKL